MPRRRRIDRPGAIQHVMNRGVARATIFHDQDDRERFLTLLSRTADECQLVVHAFALMDNHFHLAVKVQEVPLGTAMSRLGTSYALAYNQKYDRVGPVFQSRYRSILVQSGEYLRRLVRYVHLNPVTAGMITSLHELRHSALTGHRELMGIVLPRIISLPETLALFGETHELARRAIERAMSIRLPMDDYLAAHLEHSCQVGLPRNAPSSPDPTWDVAPGIAIGTSEFVANFKSPESSRANAGLEARDRVNPQLGSTQQIAQAVCDELGVHIEALASGQKTSLLSKARSAIAYLCRIKAHATIVEIAQVTGISPGGVSRAIRNGQVVASTLKFVWPGDDPRVI